MPYDKPEDDAMEVMGRDGKAHRLDDRDLPHVYRDDEDNGVATQTEEALWDEIESLRQQLRGAVEAELRAIVDEARGDREMHGIDVGALCMRVGRLVLIRLERGQ